MTRQIRYRKLDGEWYIDTFIDQEYFTSKPFRGLLTGLLVGFSKGRFRPVGLRSKEAVNMIKDLLTPEIVPLNTPWEPGTHCPEPEYHEWPWGDGFHKITT